MRRALSGLLEQLCRLRRAARGAHSRTDSSQSSQSIWRDQDDMRAHADRLRRSFPAEMDRIALFQRIRVRSRRREIGECHVPETHVIPLVLDAAAGRRDAFTVFGSDYPTPDGTCVRDYIHVSDLADAHVLALQALLQGGESEAINVGTGRGWSVLELVEVARKITRRDIPILFGPRRPGDPPALVSDPRRARERLAWSPRYPDIAEHISHAWAWRQGSGAALKTVSAHRD